jgi:hypothetical protein
MLSAYLPPTFKQVLWNTMVARDRGQRTPLNHRSQLNLCSQLATLHLQLRARLGNASIRMAKCTRQEYLQCGVTSSQINRSMLQLRLVQAR